MTKFSLIIPIYNVEKYLEQCIESCENQDLPQDEYEIIAINDGSSDDSLRILEKLESKYKNIKILSQENQGLSTARNVGLNVAKGQYIWFIDSDDWINENILNGIYEILCEHHLDALHLAYKMVSAKGKESLSTIDGLTKVFTGIVFLDKVLTKNYFACTFIFNRHFLEKWNFRFTKGIYFEDLDLIPLILLETNRICCYKHTSYFYRQRQSSIIHSVNYKLIDDLFFVCNRYKNYLLDQHLMPLKRRVLSRILAGSILSYLILLAKQDNDCNRKKRLQNILDGYKTLYLNTRLSVTKNVCILIFNISPKLLFNILCIKEYIKKRL